MKNPCILNYDTLSIGKEHRVYLLVKVEGPPEESGREPLPINLSVVIDRSGSMSGDKLAFVKQAARELVRRVGAKDTLSLVAYDSTVNTLVPPGKVEDKTRFQKAIAALQTRASTNLSGGWLQGCDHVSSQLARKGVNRVLLLTDGLANVGITEPVRLGVMARQKKRDGISTTTMGVGMGFNEDLLTKMSSQGGGAFYFIDSPDQAPTFFKEELTDLYNVVGQNLTIRVETESIVRSVTQLYDYPHHHDQGALVYQLGDLYAQEQRYQVLELSLGELEEGKTTLGQIVITYDAIQKDTVEKVENTYGIEIKAVPEGDLEVRLPVVEVEKLAFLQKIRQAREEAVELADQQKFEEARDLLRKMAEIIQESGIDDEELLNQADQLLDEAMDMEFGQERYDAHTRKSQMMKSFSSIRSDRYSESVSDQHMRYKSSKLARERGGPPPGEIYWRGESMLLSGDQISIGAAQDNEIVLDRTGVADYHCRLEREGAEWYLVDLAGKNSYLTFANAGLMDDGRFRLSAGDIIGVGRVTLKLK